MNDMKLKDLLDSATTQLRDLSPLDNPDFRLEQALYKKDEKVWEVIVSYLVEDNNKPVNPLKVFTPQTPYYRTYKRVILDDDGQVSEFLMYENKG